MTSVRSSRRRGALSWIVLSQDGTRGQANEAVPMQLDNTADSSNCGYREGLLRGAMVILAPSKRRMSILFAEYTHPATTRVIQHQESYRNTVFAQV